MRRYAKSYRDLRLNASRVVEGGKKGVSALAIVAIMLPFLVPVGVRAADDAGAVAPVVESVTDTAESTLSEITDTQSTETDDTADDAAIDSTEVTDETPALEDEVEEDTAATEDDGTSLMDEATPQSSLLALTPNVFVQPVTIQAKKVVCLSESDLPNWGDPGTQTGEPASITASTADDYVAASAGRCHLQSDWSFQYGFAEHDNTAGVHKLPGDHIGQADGTSTLGACHPTYCGNNTNTGTGYSDWKNFDTATSVAGTVPATVVIDDLEQAPGVWVRENLQDGYVPFTYPPEAVPGGDVSAEMYCYNDIQNYDNYDEVILPQLGKTYNCVAFNAQEGLTINADKVVCLSEADLPNWGDDGVQTGEPSVITGSTAADFVAASNKRCWLEDDWSFQYGFAQKDATPGVHKLYGDTVGQANGVSTAGECDPEFCGPNTNTGTGYGDWKNFDTETSGGGAISASVLVTDLEDSPGIWVRENLQDGYVPFTYPPQSAPGSNVSAEIYCHDDIQNYDNYDEIVNPTIGEDYNCVAFNAVEGVTIEAAKIVCLSEADLPNWGDDGVQTGEPALITAATAEDYVANSNKKCWLEEDWSFQYGFAEHDNTAGVHKLYGNHIGQADGTSTAGECHPTYCGGNTDTGTGYADWKNFDTSTSANGVISAAVSIADLEGAPGIWIRENLQDGYVPFSYPPDDVPGSNVSAELYCHNDIQNYDNYDEVILPTVGQTYYCVAFNALEDGNDGNDCELLERCSNPDPDPKGSISGVVFNDENQNGVQDEGEEELSGWRVYIDENDNDTLDGSEVYDDTASPYLISNLDAGLYTVRLVLQSGWVQTTPEDEHSVDVSVGEDEIGWDFGVFNDDSGDGDGNGNGGGNRNSSTGGRRAPTVLNTSLNDQEELPGQVLGATTPTPTVAGLTLPRTGIAVTWLMVLSALGLAPLFKRKQSEG